MAKHCRICGAGDVANASGRCQSCIDAKAATDAGLTYGKYKGLQYEKMCKEERKQKELVAQIKAESRARAAERAAREAEDRARQEEEKRAKKEAEKKAERKERALRAKQGGRDTEKLCEVCGKQIQPPRARYCSIECNKKAIREQYRTERNNEVRCQICGGEVGRGRRKYCDACAALVWQHDGHRTRRKVKTQ